MGQAVIIRVAMAFFIRTRKAVIVLVAAKIIWQEYVIPIYGFKIAVFNTVYVVLYHVATLCPLILLATVMWESSTPYCNKLLAIAL